MKTRRVLSLAWKSWFVANTVGWTVYECNKPREHTRVAEIHAIATGVSIGFVCGIAPPVFFSYVADECRDRN